MIMSHRRAMRGLLLASVSVLGAGLGQAVGAVKDYPNGSTDNNPIVLTDNTTQLQVLTGSATQSGVISQSGGTFGLEKIGSGILTLSGNNTYAGGTMISAGTVIAGSATAFGTGTVTMASGTTMGISSTISNSIKLGGGGTVLVDVSQSGELSGVVSDANSGAPGTLVKSGSGILVLTGNNTYTGGTVINGGTVFVGSFNPFNSISGALGSGNIVNNGILVITRLDPVTIAGDISGTGSLSVGTGLAGTSVTLSGNNIYSGATTVTNNGLLLAGSATGLSRNSAVTITSSTGAGIALNGFNSTIGSLASTAAAASVSNTSTIAAVLTTGGNNTSTSYAGRLADGSPGIGITGASLGLTKTGTGTFTLSGNGQTYTGLTTIGAGTLALNGTASLATSSGVAANGVFDIQGVTGTSATIKTLTGSGSVVMGTKGLVLSAGAGTFSGVISGSGGRLTITGGSQTLTGINTYTGDTTIAAGAGLQLGSGGTSGSLASSSIVNNGTLTVNRSDAVTYSGVISGSGGFSATGTGTFTLTGANTYTGGTTIGAGATLQLGNGSSGSMVGNIINNGTLIANRSSGAFVFNSVISGSGAVIARGSLGLTLIGDSTYTGGTTIEAGSYLQVGGFISSMTGSVVGNIVNNGILIFSRIKTTTFTGVISGSGSLFHGSTGTTLTLTGNNSYTGGTTIEGGGTILQIGNGGTSGSIVGDVIDNYMLLFNRSDAVTFAGAISGTGQVRQLGAGVLTLSGNSTYTGATIVSAGTLAVNGSIASSSVTVSSGGTLAGTGIVGATTVASGATISAGVGGVGTLAVSGNLVLNAGATTLVDLTTSAADKITASGTASLNGALNVSFGAGSFTGAQYAIVTSTGALSGTFSSLNLTGAPADIATSLVYDANNAYLKLVSVFSAGSSFNLDSGTVSVMGSQTTGGLSGTGGTVNVNGGSLTINQGGNTTFGGAVTGTGALIKTGTGTLLLTGNSSGFTGTTSVNGGKLQVGNASTPGTTLGGTVTVGSGGALGGNGTLTGSVINAGSTAPGSSIGTLTVGGNYTFASGASLEQEVAANGTADRLIVGGTVTIAGNTTMQVVPTEAAANFGRVTSYTVITSSGGISGSFANVTSAAATLTPYVGYSGNAVTLSLVRNDISLANLGTTANQRGVATAIQANASGAVYAAVAPMTDAQLPASFDSLSGEVHATLTDAMLYDGGWLADAVQSRGDAGDGLHLWGSEEYRSSSLDGNANAAMAKDNLLGTAAGADFQLMEGVRIGAVMGYSHGIVRVDGRNSEARMNSFLFGGYAGIREDDFTIDAVIDGGWNNVGTFRLANVAGVLQAQTADYNATTFNAFIEARYRFDLGGLSFSPFVNLHSVSVEKDAFTETGGSAALRGGATDHSVMFTNFGGRFETSYDIRGGKLAPWFSMAWEHATDTLSASQAMAFASGPSFNVLGAPITKDAFAIQAGLGIALGGINLNLAYAGRQGGASSENTVRFSLEAAL